MCFSLNKKKQFSLKTLSRTYYWYESKIVDLIYQENFEEWKNRKFFTFFWDNWRRWENNKKFAEFLHLYIKRFYFIPLGTIRKATATTTTTITTKDRILRLKKSNEIYGNLILRFKEKCSFRENFGKQSSQ